MMTFVLFSSGAWGWLLPWLAPLLLLTYTVAKYGWKEKTRRKRRLADSIGNIVLTPPARPMALIGKARGLTPTITSDAVKTAGKVGLLLLMFTLGWFWRDHQLVSNEHRYQDVLVADRYDSQHFLLRPAGMKPYKFEFDSPQDFLPGQKMMEVRYEQRLGVKRLIRADFCPEYCDSIGRRISYREEIANNAGN